MVEAGKDQRHGPGSCFPALGMSYLVLGIPWVYRKQKSLHKPPGTGSSWCEAIAGLERVAMTDSKHEHKNRI